MGLVNGRITNSNNLQNNTEIISKKTGWVYDVILDETHEYAKSKGYGSAVIGSILFRTTDMMDIPSAQLPLAHPSDKNFINIPVVNEVVEIYEFARGAYAYRRIGNSPNPSLSASEDAISSHIISDKKDSAGTKDDYQKVSETGISKSNSSNSNKYNGFGKYYNPQASIHKLKLYEGDSLIESRFGQSIRFSGFNNSQNKFYPTLIIRNLQSSKYKEKEPGQSAEEDINTDGSIIAMTSDQFQLGFLPGVVDDKGKSDFQTKPDSFMDYPSKLIGDQLLLNSGRIIISAKNAEMIFYSKKNYGFISDGAMSIDNKLGIDVSVGDDINIITNDRDIQMVTGNGSIILGSKDLEPIVKGQQLVDILGELIDAITQQMFLTPAGPTAVGPTNISDFGSIKSKLNNILSKLNQTS
jgi:hypothetical protein